MHSLLRRRIVLRRYRRRRHRKLSPRRGGRRFRDSAGQPQQLPQAPRVAWSVALPVIVKVDVDVLA
jgi:hypothetical protein